MGEVARGGEGDREGINRTECREICRPARVLDI
jgi:hypothetical protein